MTEGQVISSEKEVELSTQEYQKKFMQEFDLAAKVLSKGVKDSEEAQAEFVDNLRHEFLDFRIRQNSPAPLSPDEEIQELKSYLIAKVKADMESVLLETEKTSDDVRDQYYADKIALLALKGSGKENLPYGEIIIWLTDGGMLKKINTPLYHELDADAFRVLESLNKIDDSMLNQNILSRYKTLPMQVGERLIEKGDAYYALDSQYYGRFEARGPKMAEALISKGNVNMVTQSFERFENIDPVWALTKKIKYRAEAVMDGIMDLKFIEEKVQEPEDKAKCLKLLIDNGFEISAQDIKSILPEHEQETMLEHLEKITTARKVVFEKDRKYVIGGPHGNRDFMKFVEDGHAPLLTKYCDMYQMHSSLSERWFIDILRKNHQEWFALREHLINDSETANSVLKAMVAEGDIDIVISKFTSLRGDVKLDKDLAEEFMKRGYTEEVGKNLDAFEGLSPETFDFFLNKYKSNPVYQDLQSFDLSKEKLITIIDQAISLGHSGSLIYYLKLPYFYQKGVFDYFIEKLPVILERAKGSSFNKDNFFHQIRILPKAEQIKGLQKLIDLGKISEVFITIEEYQAQGLEEIAYRCTPDDFHDLHLSPEEVDSKIEQSGPVLYQAFLKCGATPEESFYKKNKTLFFDGNNLKESFFKRFRNFVSTGVLPRTAESVKRFEVVLDELNKFADDDRFVELYISKTKELNEAERRVYFGHLQLNAENIAHNTSIDSEKIDEYEMSVRMVYPQRNYNTYKFINEYKDRSEDLDPYKFDKNGYAMKLDGILGYKILEGQTSNEDLLKEYSTRIESIGRLANKSALAEFLKDKNPGQKTKTLEGQIIEYLRNWGYTKDTMNVVLAYQLSGDYEQFVGGSRDRVESSEDEITKQYVMLDELLDRYGDRMKETLKGLKEGIEKSEEDKKQLSENSYIDSISKIEEKGTKVKTDFEKIPKDMRRDKAFRKKIESTWRTTFQSEGTIQEGATEFAQNFSLSDLEAENFTELWNSRVQDFFKKLDPGVNLIEVEKLQVQIYQELQKEANKYEEIKEVETEKKGGVEKKSSKERTIKGYFSKNKENAHARMVGDICLAGDPKMLEDKNYFEFVLFDEERTKCMGTTMLKVLEEPDGKKYLLYCPNPSVGLVSEVSAKKLYKTMTDRVIAFARGNNFDGVVLNKTHGRSTNRAGLFQGALDQSVLKENGTEVVLNLSQIYKLSSYAYKDDLRYVYRK